MVVKASKFIVSGRVQMVGYRRFVVTEARELGVAGYVENLANGSVVILAQADRKTLGEFARKVARPPPPAVVKETKESAAKVSPRMKDFSVRYGTMQEEFQEIIGGMETQFEDYRGEFKDYRAEFQDYRTEFKDYRGEFKSFASRTDENFKSLEAKYGSISDKLSEILAALTDQAKKTQEMLESMRGEARRTAETLNESLRLLRDAVEKLPRSS